MFHLQHYQYIYSNYQAVQEEQGVIGKIANRRKKRKAQIINYVTQKQSVYQIADSAADNQACGNIEQITLRSLPEHKKYNRGYHHRSQSDKKPAHIVEHSKRNSAVFNVSQPENIVDYRNRTDRLQMISNKILDYLVGGDNHRAD